MSLPDPVDVHVGLMVRAQRVKLGMSQTKLAKACGGITFQQIQKYEQGINRVSMSRMAMIAAALKVEPAFFLAGMVNGMPPTATPEPTTLIEGRVIKAMRAMTTAQRAALADLVEASVPATRGERS